jgi:hypothetical protein
MSSMNNLSMPNLSQCGANGTGIGMGNTSGASGIAGLASGTSMPNPASYVNNAALSMSKGLPMGGDPTGLAPQMLGASSALANPGGLLASLFGGL